MAVIRDRDIPRGRRSFAFWRQWMASNASKCCPDDEGTEFRRGAAAERARKRTDDVMEPSRQDIAMAVRYTLHLLEERAPGGAVEVRVPPWGAVKILDGPQSDPHNLTPPDVIELDPETWLRLAAGLSTWDEERAMGRISAVGERDDLSGLLPLSDAHTDSHDA